MSGTVALGRPLIRTKLLAPVPRDAVARPEVMARLVQGPPRALTVVRAPAGWGKSTLLAAWAASDPRDFTWLALDRLDSEPQRFFTYLIHALRALAPGAGERSLPIAAAGGELIDEVLPALFEELEGLGGSVLVLDDYHVIAHAAVHDALAFLIEHAPPALEVVLSSRTEPALPLARLRGRGALLEVAAQDLRFSAREARELLNGQQGLELSEADVDRLVERTEGWPAGLYLAALSLRGRPDRAGAVRRFAGDDRHIVDYLTEEVLSGQPDDVREFLLATCVLERLSAPLCDAVTGRDDGAAMLRRIERANLFLVPLDHQREWYRYHHLFADLLQLEVRDAKALHGRAAQWMLEAGDTAGAIRHTQAAGDTAGLIELVAAAWLPAMTSGSNYDARRWLEAIPHQAATADSRLCVAWAMTLISTGELDAVQPWIDAAERAPAGGPSYDGFASGKAGAAYLRSVHRWQLGDAGGTRAAARDALAIGLPPIWEAVVLAMLAGATYWLGDTEDGERLTHEALAACRAVGFRPPEVSCLVMLAAIAQQHADAAAARHYAHAALDLAREEGVLEYWIAAAPHTVLGELDGDRAELERGLELARRGSGRLGVAHALIPLALAAHAGGEPDSARAFLAEARAIVAECADPGPLTTSLLADAERRLGGRTAAARRAPGDEEFSDRELQVLRMLAGPLSQREIGAELFISFNTVKSHTKAIYRKLGAADRQDAVARAREQQLL